MNRRHALASLATSLTCPALATVAADSGRTTRKKGWAGGDARLHRLFGAHWYYTWSPKTRPSQAAEFVPMIKGAWSLKQRPAIQKMPGITHLLGFNEPSREKQGNLSAEEALSLWPQLADLAAKKKLRLGSPAPTSDRRGLAWLDAFMEQAEQRKLKVDFVAVHWYRSHNAGEFETFVEELSRAYRRPLWITEFNGWSGPEKENRKFLEESLRFLERNDEVERYAYFNPKKGTPLSLLNADGSPSEMGKLYRDA